MYKVWEFFESVQKASWWLIVYGIIAGMMTSFYFMGPIVLFAIFIIEGYLNSALEDCSLKRRRLEKEEYLRTKANSREKLFLKSTRIYSRILFCGWLLCSVVVMFTANSIETFFTVFFLVTLFLSPCIITVEYKVNLVFVDIRRAEQQKIAEEWKARVEQERKEAKHRQLELQKEREEKAEAAKQKEEQRPALKNDDREKLEQWRADLNSNTEDTIVIDNGIKNISSNMLVINLMEGHSFEYYCADILRKNGFENVSVTRGSGDQGGDVLATKEGVKYIIQCKRYANPVGNKAVQEAYAGIAFYKCHVGVVMTNSTFTPSAKELAEATGVLLWDRTVLQKMVEKSYFTKS